MAWHARISASGMKRTLSCPGSVALSESMPRHLRRGSGPAARLGTAAHGLGERVLRDYLEQGLGDVYGYLGGTVYLDANEDAIVVAPGAIDTDEGLEWALKARESAAHSFPIDDDMCAAVAVYVDVCHEEMAKLSDPEMLVERSFNLDWLRPDLGGTGDCTIFEFLGTLVVIDYKHGQGVPVDVADNEQMLTYALGMAQEVDWLFERLVLIIVQPRCGHLEGPVRRWETTKERLYEFSAELAAGYDHAMAAGEALTEHHARSELGTIAAVPPGWADEYLQAGDHCMFCDANGPLCPAMRRRIQEVARCDFDGVAEDEDQLAAELPSQEDLLNEEVAHRLAEVLDWVPAIDRFIKAAKSLGFMHAAAGHKVPGHKLVEGRAIRKYVVPEARIVERVLEAKPDLDPDRLYEPKKLKSPAQLEKLGPFAKRLVNGVQGEEGWSVEPLAAKPRGSLSLVPDSNPKPEVTLDPGADFSDVEEEDE